MTFYTTTTEFRNATLTRTVTKKIVAKEIDKSVYATTISAIIVITAVILCYWFSKKSR